MKVLNLKKAVVFIAEAQRRRERREFNVFHGEIGNYRMNALLYVFTLMVKEVSKEKSRYLAKSLRLCDKISHLPRFLTEEFRINKNFVNLADFVRDKNTDKNYGQDNKSKTQKKGG